MFDVVHQMRTRIITSPSFGGDRILGAILFENTMDREIEGQSTASYLWKVKNVVPFLKVDQGLAAEKDGVQLMKPIDGLAKLLGKAKANGIFGTKMRSVIKQANPDGIRAIVSQQFEIGKQIVAAGLVPIIEPEVDIHCPDKAKAEDLLHAEIMKALNKLVEKRTRHVEVDAAGEGQPVHRLHCAPEYRSRRGTFRRIFSRRGEPAAGCQQRYGREFLARAVGRPQSAAERGGIRRHAGRIHWRNRCSVRNLTFIVALAA